MTIPLMARTNFVKLEVYRIAESLCDEVWRIVVTWPRFEKDTVGKQLVRAADSIAANIAEGVGRGTYQDNRRFVRIARGSLHETQCWLRRAFSRGLLKDPDVAVLRPMIDQLAPQLNAYLKSIGSSRRSSNGDQERGAPSTDH